MKKASLLFNFILIGIIAVMASSMSSAGSAAQSAAFKTCVDCTNDSFYGLTVNDFVKGVARYRKTHWDRINTDPYMQTDQRGLQDARACWYSIDTLKKFICLVEKYSGNLGIKSSQLGIRFYYATYPYKGTWYPPYYSHHTLFMVPTYTDDKTKDNIDFDPRYDVQAKRGVEPLSQIGRENFSVQLLMLDGTTANAAHITAKNQGQLCPPTCPAVTGLSSTTNMMEYVDQLYPTGLGWKN